MKHLPFCSIIVLNYNGKHFLKDCFNSLKKLNYPKNRYEVILVDNASTDGSVEYVKKNFPWVKVVQLDKNYGFAEGNNRGLRHAKGEYIVFLNNDTVVDENWLIELVKVAVSDEKIAVCGSKVLHYNDPKRLQYAGGYLDMFGAPWHRGDGEIDTGKYDKVEDVFYVFGCSMLVKKNVLKKLKYCFDPRYFIYFEETDLCWRLKLLGYRIVYVPNSIVYHKGGGTTQAKEKFVYMLYRNKIWSFKKNLRFPLKQIILSLVLFRMGIIILWRILRGEWHTGFLVFRHIFDKIENDIDMKKISLKRQIKSFSSFFIVKKYVKVK